MLDLVNLNRFSHETAHTDLLIRSWHPAEESQDWTSECDHEATSELRLGSNGAASLDVILVGIITPDIKQLT